MQINGTVSAGFMQTDLTQPKTQLNSTQLYCDVLAAEQLNSWIAKYSSIALAYKCGIMQYTKRTIIQSKYNEWYNNTIQWKHVAIPDKCYRVMWPIIIQINEAVNILPAKQRRKTIRRSTDWHGQYSPWNESSRLVNTTGPPPTQPHASAVHGGRLSSLLITDQET